MSTHKNIDKICLSIIAFTLIFTFIFCNSEVLFNKISTHEIGYESRIFDNSNVHKIDIVMNDWEDFIENCANEEYSPCSVVIDGEAFKNVGIRAKGNTSLSSVSKTGSERYSFKIEFDHYVETKSYYGLDKLCLNNIIQDNTFMKDYISYTVMSEFGVSAPLCSYAYITVNGEDFGLYLAVEGVEESFLQRNYGSDYGNLYKPDSSSLGGGRGNGKDFDFNNSENENTNNKDNREFGNDRQNFAPNDAFNVNNFQDTKNNKGFGNQGGNDDVKLKYIDDNADSYPNIFDNAKPEISSADKNRLINSLRILSEGKNIESVVDIDSVIKYFAVHNFLCNGDSYTGSIIHNYYLYEEDGRLSMIPWDYNLAFGTFQNSNATSSVNSPIDTPASGNMSELPMLNWIFESEEYTAEYHEMLEQFINQTDFISLIDKTASLLDEYVEKDPTKFCSYEDFMDGISALREFCYLRSESIKGQLNGAIPSTSEGQTENKSALIDASSLNLSDMGTMNMGGNSVDFRNNQGGKPEFGNKGTVPFENNGTESFVPPNSNDRNAEQFDPDAKEEFRPENSTLQTQSYATSPLLLLGISVFVLISGIIIALKLKRR